MYKIIEENIICVCEPMTLHSLAWQGFYNYFSPLPLKKIETFLTQISLNIFTNLLVRSCAVHSLNIKIILI